MKALTESNFQFPGQTAIYRGKVREVYHINNQLMVMVVTDRLSAFDVILPKGIPYKGQILNQTAALMMQQTQDIVPNWLLDTPDPNVAVGHLCTPFKVEMVIRGYLAGHAARTYATGSRTLCGVPLPHGLIENDPLPQPIITPTTKADKGLHDEDISKIDLLNQNLVSEKDYAILEDYTYKLFERGSQLAKEKGLILVDAKYEFGKKSNGEIVLIDEIHTPDSARYFYADGYQEKQNKRIKQKQLSKEFVRQWLISEGFQGKEGQKVPLMDDAFVTQISNRYIELFEKITNTSFVKANIEEIDKRINHNVTQYLSNFLQST